MPAIEIAAARDSMKGRVVIGVASAVSATVGGQIRQITPHSSSAIGAGAP
jgi:hypothetical protein